MSTTIKLLMVLPAILKIAWLLLLLGMAALATGYFTNTPWQSHSGLMCLIVGYVIVILDMVSRKRHRGEAAGFYVGATLAPLIGLVILTFLALLGAVVLVIQSMIHGFSESHAMRLLHFLGVIFAFVIVLGIPSLALHSRPDAKTETNSDDQLATAPELNSDDDSKPQSESERPSQ